MHSELHVEMIVPEVIEAIISTELIIKNNFIHRIVFAVCTQLGYVITIVIFLTFLEHRSQKYSLQHSLLSSNTKSAIIPNFYHSQ